MSKEEQEPLQPDKHNPDIQSGVSGAEAKNLQAAGDDHPLVERVGHKNTIEWNVPPVVLKNVSDGLYQSEEATVREFAANSETATLRTERGDARLVEENYQPVVEVTYRGEENKIIIQDNGIGMSSSVVLDVLRKIGVTTVRNDSGYSGAFGMGFASFLKMTSLDGYMVMKTHSRITDENYAVYIGLGGYEPIGGGLPDDVYGTRFEMIHLDEDEGGPSRTDIREYVEKYSEWLRVPVHYEEYDSDGFQEFDEDWGGKKFEDTYQNDVVRTVIEEPGFFRAVSSPESEGETLLLSMPIERNDSGYGANKYGAHFQFDVRLLAEDGKVVKGPNKGLTPINDSEYRVMDDETKEQFVPSSELTNDDLCLPEPTSSRDSLQENEEFWEWLGERFEEKLYEDCGDIAENLDSVDELLNMKGRDLYKLAVASRNIQSNSTKSLQDGFRHRTGATISERQAAFISKMEEKERWAERHTENIHKKSNLEGEKVTKIIGKSNPGGDVYMGQSLNQDKARVVWEMHPNNQIVMVDSEDYEKYEKGFGWKQLKDISLHNLSEYNISADLYQEITGVDPAEENIDVNTDSVKRADPTPSDEETLTLSIDRGHNRKEISRDIKEAFENDRAIGKARSSARRKSDSNPIRRIVCFPTNTEENLSDHYWIAGNDADGMATAVTNCNVKTYNYLKDMSGVVHIEEYKQNAGKWRLKTHKGRRSLGNHPDDIVIHVVPEGMEDAFMNVSSEMVNAIPEQHKNGEYSVSYSQGKYPNEEDMLYVPLTADKLFKIRPAIREHNVTVVAGEHKPRDVPATSIYSDFRLYARARLSDYDNDAVKNLLLESIDIDMKDGGYALVEALAPDDCSG